MALAPDQKVVSELLYIRAAGKPCNPTYLAHKSQGIVVGDYVVVPTGPISYSVVRVIGVDVELTDAEKKRFHVFVTDVVDVAKSLALQKQVADFSGVKNSGHDHIYLPHNMNEAIDASTRSKNITTMPEIEKPYSIVREGDTWVCKYEGYEFATADSEDEAIFMCNAHNGKK